MLLFKQLWIESHHKANKIVTCANKQCLEFQQFDTRPEEISPKLLLLPFYRKRVCIFAKIKRQSSCKPRHPSPAP